MESKDDRDEIPTAKVTRAVELADLRKHQRSQDKFFDDIIRPLIAPAIILIMTSIGGLIWKGIDLLTTLHILEFKIEMMQKQMTETTVKNDRITRLEEAINQSKQPLNR